jgi:hypothetical protein
MIFHFLHLIDTKLPRFDDIASHPPAVARVKMLLGRVSANKAGSEQMVAGLRKHYGLLLSNY